jgi:hypothetical protein
MDEVSNDHSQNQADCGHAVGLGVAPELGLVIGCVHSSPLVSREEGAGKVPKRRLRGSQQDHCYYRVASLPERQQFTRLRVIPQLSPQRVISRTAIWPA